MSAVEAAERSLRDGDAAAALTHLQEAVRAKADDAKLRVFLFQLLCVTGQWERAANQLEVASTLDPGALAMAQTYREALRCELLRGRVFDGKTAPMVFGEPEQWLALLIESLLVGGRGNAEEAASLRERAFDEAPATAGTLNGQPFTWIADADMRLGPVLEGIINGRYYWVPFSRLTRVALEAPEDLRDIVWAPAHLELENGGEAYALIPSRYAYSEKSTDPQIVLGRTTEWQDRGNEFFCGLGQRVLATDSGEISLLEVRDIVLGDQPTAREP
jgi:type VI secretion system protein ImpE